MYATYRTLIKNNLQVLYETIALAENSFRHVKHVDVLGNSTPARISAMYALNGLKSKVQREVS